MLQRHVYHILLLLKILEDGLGGRLQIEAAAGGNSGLALSLEIDLGLDIRTNGELDDTGHVDLETLDNDIELAAQSTAQVGNNLGNLSLQLSDEGALKIQDDVEELALGEEVGDRRQEVDEGVFERGKDLELEVGFDLGSDLGLELLDNGLLGSLQLDIAGLDDTTQELQVNVKLSSYFFTDLSCESEKRDSQYQMFFIDTWG